MADTTPSIYAIETKETAEESPLIDGVFRYGFSECVNNERTMFYYTETAQTCSTDPSFNVTTIAKPPVRGLRCDVVCDKGYFLGANLTGPVPISGCEKCPRGKYSLGGGKLYSKRTNAWTNPLPIDIHSECVTRNLYTNEWSNNCQPWQASADGSMISSGANRNILEQYNAGRLFSSLRISTTYVRNGTLTFQFRVSAEPPYDGLVFAIDDQTVMKLISHTNGWDEAVVKVTAGSHTFSWDYTKDSIGDEGEDRAYIKVIELVGTSYSDLYCHPCGQDVTMNGGSLCAFCHENEYAAQRSDSEVDYTCYPCPTDTFAPKGSIGEEACVARRPCTADDVVSEYTACIDGKRNATFTWSIPKTCESELPGATSLPDPTTGVTCDPCPIGMLLNEQNECTTCPLGERLVVKENTCAKCPIGQVVLNQIEFGRGTKDGWNTGWPWLMDSETAQVNGWKLTQDGILFEPVRGTTHTPRNIHHSKSTSTAASRYILPFNLTMVRTGSIELMYSLENVPTFASTGERAWLEMEMEDLSPSTGTKTGTETVVVEDEEEDDEDEEAEEKDDESTGDEDSALVHGEILHLENGAMNGTYTETIPLNITLSTTKRFRLILRTSSVIASRQIRVKLLYLRIVGSAQGAGVSCTTCPRGYQAMHTSEFSGCYMCPAGSYAPEPSPNSPSMCTECPVNTFSMAGATQCEPCGMNTYSKKGAAICAAPQHLSVNRTSTPSGASSGTITYNLKAIQSLVYGNESNNMNVQGDIDGDHIIAAGDHQDMSSEDSGLLLPTTAVVPFHAFRISDTTAMFGGLFVPLSSAYQSRVKGHIVEDTLVHGDDTLDGSQSHAYNILLHVINPSDAGGTFAQSTSLYGSVQCEVPTQWKVVSGGNTMSIEGFGNGTGLQVTYTEGTPCKNNDHIGATTSIVFVCDMDFTTFTPPQQASYDPERCHTSMEWKTAYACPLCEQSDFEQLKTPCVEGQQSVQYNRKRVCFGGVEPSGNPISTCSDITLDSKALYTAYAVMSIVAFVILLLMGGILILHRKYRTAYNEYMYLKGKMPINEVITCKGVKEQTFEFTPKNNALDSPGDISPTSSTTPNSPPHQPGEEEEAEFTVTSV